MAEPPLKVRSWIVELVPDDVQVRCSYRRREKRIVRYTVQLEVKRPEGWTPVVRYDNAHGFCHRDTMHGDGTQDKEAVFSGDENETFTLAIEDLRVHWEAYRARFVGELKK